MKTSPFLLVIFYLAVAVCLWPLYVHATQVVGWAQASFKLDRSFHLPNAVVATHALQAALILWAIGAGLVLYRKGQASTAWLIVLLALAPTLAGFAATA